MTDRAQQYFLQLNFAGGVWATGVRTVAVGQTDTFDVRALRDLQVPDEQGRTIPADAAGGQVEWSVDGGENLTLIGRAEQAAPAAGVSSSYACLNCCPASPFDFWLAPGSVTGFPGDTTQFVAWQQNANCYGTPLAPTTRSATFSSTNPFVAFCNSTGFATAQNPGTTDIQGRWQTFLWEFTGTSCTKTPFNVLAEAICDVFRSDEVNLRADNEGDRLEVVISLKERAKP